MSAPAYIVTNLLAAAAAITVDTEDAIFVRGNLYDKVLGKPFKFASHSAGYIEIDNGSAKQYDTIAILGHNLTADGSVVVKGGGSANPATTIGTAVYREDSLWINVGSRNERYTRVIFADTNPDAITIGELVIGKRIALPRPPRWGVQPTKEETDLTFETVRGVNSSYKLANREKRKFTFRFPQSEYSSFKALHELTGGQVTPFVWLPNPASEAEVLYVRKQPNCEPQAMDQPGRDSDGLRHWYDFTLELREEVHGALVLA
jgi:hypothetical protein